ncbi:unnamed protein product [Polarella glacialis]|uniref:RING-type domain-containing protein n=1 Tax=Polarella glacialis TaxID=89957 RepID=A0A813J746_POLGL|nr:unnamed protein product [Polarella glacialis]
MPSTGRTVLMFGRKHVGSTFDEIIENDPTYIPWLEEHQPGNDRFEALIDYCREVHGGIMEYGLYAGHSFNHVATIHARHAEFLVRKHSDNPRYSKFVAYYKNEFQAAPQQHQQLRRTASPVGVQATLNRRPQVQLPHQLAISSGSGAALDSDPNCSELDTSSDEESSGDGQMPEKYHYRNCCQEVLQKSKTPMHFKELARKAAKVLLKKGRKSKAKAKAVPNRRGQIPRRLKKDKNTKALEQLKCLASLPSHWLSRSDGFVRLRSAHKLSFRLPQSAASCTICMARAINAAFVPCGHAAACSECSEKCRRTNGCPICRKPVDTVLRTWQV